MCREACRPRRIFRLLREIDDRDERERTRREWGLVGLDDWGRLRPIRHYGSGLHGQINRGIAGADWEEYFGGRSEGLAVFEKQAAERTRRDRYLRGSQVAQLYEAASYLNQEHGVCLNSHVTIVYSLLGITDQRQAAELLSDFHRLTAAWFRRREARYQYLYVHENAGAWGFHTHLLIHFPRNLHRRRPCSILAMWSASSAA
jgi:hypothetical protein